MTSPDVDDLELLLEQGDDRALRRFLLLLHPADIAFLLNRLQHDYWPRIVGQLDSSMVSDVMEELPDDLRDDLAELLSPRELTSAFGHMASDDAADVIADLPPETAKAVLAAMPAEDRREVEQLLEYPEDTAGGLMQLELVAVPQHATISEAIETIRRQADEVGDLHFVYVVDDDGRLVGYLPLHRLILARSEQPVSQIMKTEVISVTPDVDQEEVARIFKRYDLVSLPVVDENGVLLGRIMHDDVVDVFEEEADEDIMRMAGAEEPELVYTNRVFRISAARLPWLIGNAFGGLVSGTLLWKFRLSFPDKLTLLVFIPVIAAMGGNVGTQSATIVVRGFATGRVDFHNLMRVLVKEVVVGVIMGLVCGLAVGILARFWKGDPVLGLTVGIAMAAAMTISTLMGVVVPSFFKLIRVDPALASGPLVTTANDIIGISTYYMVASIIIT
ncbi:MAG: magnesium transporter [Deltaproteobacteria bacterium]|nr:MAG: magnesium transporter [Deltaproteobacteria bacterium]